LLNSLFRTLLNSQKSYEGTEPVSRTAVVRPIVGSISLGVPEEAYGGKMAGTLSIITKDGYILSCGIL